MTPARLPHLPFPTWGAADREEAEVSRRLPREVLAEIPPSAWTDPPAPKVQPEPSEADIDAACAWSDFRKDYGVSADDADRSREHRAFVAGFKAGREGDQSAVLR